MKRFTAQKSVLTLLLIGLVIAAAMGGIALRDVVHADNASKHKQTTKQHFCGNLGKKYQASTGAQMYCNGPQQGYTAHKMLPHKYTISSNTDAASPSEDVSPANVQAYGQTETSVAAIDNYVVEAWNDATAFYSECGSPMNKEETTGLGFSVDKGKTFQDMGSPPNANCAVYKYGGDPSVETWKVNGKDYFYISSLYNEYVAGSSDYRSYIALAACTVSGTGSAATLNCGQPVMVAQSSQCDTNFGYCSFLDKDFLSIDPVHGLLYASYTDFLLDFNQQVDLAVCDIGNGKLGGTPAAPVCTNGSGGSVEEPNPPYFVVAGEDPNGCENEGAYPAVDTSTGGVYVAYEHNWLTSLSAFPGYVCGMSPVQNVMNYIPASCLTLPTASCSDPAASKDINVFSMEAAFIPGYNRFPMNDFPRLAVSPSRGTVSMVWNDARYHPTGDILMQSFALGTLSLATTAPIQLNNDSDGCHFLPALRNADWAGRLTVSWYSRSSANTALTDVSLARGINPLTASTPTHSTITTGPSDWNAVSSDIVPNFGDYTDNYVQATDRGTFTEDKVFVAWSDGRLGDPQPFCALTYT